MGHGTSSTADAAWLAARRRKCPDAPTAAAPVHKCGKTRGLLTSPGNVVPGVKMKECNEMCGTLENKEEGNESNCAGCCGLQHAGSNPAVALHGANTLPETKNSGSGTPQNRTLRIRRTRTVPEISWGMIKKLMKEAEELLQRTSFPLTPDNLFLAMTALIHLNSCASVESELNSEQAS